MALQPKRTWSAEDERRKRLEEDPDAYDVGPHSVTCAGCHRPIRLNATGRYYAANWNKHKMGCKNTNAVNGANAMSAESKFTGRVAAFRVAKPSESSEPLTLSTSSNNPTPHELDRIRADGPRPSQLYPLDRDRSASSRFTRPPNLQFEQHAYGNNAISHDRPRALPYPSLRSNSSGAVYGNRSQSPLLGSHRSSRSPNAPALRLEERESYGSSEAPFRSDQVQNDRSSHGIHTFGVQRGRANSTPSHHSEDTQRLAYLHSRDAFPESDHLDKGKRRYFEPTHSISHHYSPLRKYVHLGADSRTYDRADDLDSYPSRTEASDVSSPSNKARDWRESHGISDIDSNSTASPPGFGTRQAGRSPKIPASFSPRPLPQDRIDDRVLPPLSSLSLSRTGATGPSRTTDRSSGHSSRVHYDSSRAMTVPEEGYSWRERTRAWVQTGATSLVDRDSPESVVLPPIRDASKLPQGSSAGVRRRQREDDEHDDNSMDEDRPSPLKVLVLPLGQSHSASTPRADDLSLEYKHVDISPGEDTSFGGDSTFVGNHSQYGRKNLSATKTDAPRLHPVWKWEQRGEAQGSSGAS